MTDEQEREIRDRARKVLRDYNIDCTHGLHGERMCTTCMFYVLVRYEYAAAIVRDLASRSPWVDAAAGTIEQLKPQMLMNSDTGEREHEDYGKCDWKCLLCGVGAGDMEIEDIKHDPACPWWRAAKANQ